jgi:hypothetical protein
MAAPSRIEGDVYVNGTLTPRVLSIPALTLVNAGVAAAAEISASKLQHRHAVQYRQSAGADVVTQTQEVYVVYGATGTVVAVDTSCSTAPTGGDKAFTVDVQKSTGGGAFATILSSTVSWSSSHTSRTIRSGTINSASLVADDILRVIITASGSTGSQGQGLVVNILLDEASA